MATLNIIAPSSLMSHLCRLCVTSYNPFQLPCTRGPVVRYVSVSPDDEIASTVNLVIPDDMDTPDFRTDLLDSIKKEFR